MPLTLRRTSTCNPHRKKERQIARADRVSYAYKCAVCGHCGERRCDNDSCDGDTTTCVFCGAPVTLEWDGGVTFETPKIIADEAIARARELPGKTRSVAWTITTSNNPNKLEPRWPKRGSVRIRLNGR